MKKKVTRDYCIPLITKTKRIMKITTFFLLVTVCSITASTYAQNYKVSINKQNSSIIEILKDEAYLAKVARQGAERARESAQKTLQEVKEVIGFRRLF